MGSALELQAATQLARYLTQYFRKHPLEVKPAEMDTLGPDPLGRRVAPGLADHAQQRIDTFIGKTGRSGRHHSIILAAGRGRRLTKIAHVEAAGLAEAQACAPARPAA